MKSPQHIYADNASTTQLDPDALEAMLPFMREGFANPSALHSGAKKARHAVEDARRIIAECINAKPQEIIFTSCGTESDNWAIKGVAKSQNPKHARFITCAIEHHAILNCFDALQRKGFSTTILPVDGDGIVSANDLESASHGADSGLLSVMLANNEHGFIFIRDQKFQTIQRMVQQYIFLQNSSNFIDILGLAKLSNMEACDKLLSKHIAAEGITICNCGQSVPCVRDDDKYVKYPMLKSCVLYHEQHHVRRLEGRCDAKRSDPYAEPWGENEEGLYECEASIAELRCTKKAMKKQCGVEYDPLLDIYRRDISDCVYAYSKQILGIIGLIRKHCPNIRIP